MSFSKGMQPESKLDGFIKVHFIVFTPREDMSVFALGTGLTSRTALPPVRIQRVRGKRHFSLRNEMYSPADRRPIPS